MDKRVTRAGLRFAAITGIAVMGLTPATQAAPGGGPPGGGGSYGGGFGSQSPRSPDSRSGDSSGYDFSGPKFQFSMRKKPPATQDNTGGPPGGGGSYGGGFGSQSPRSPDSRSGDSSGYDFSGPKFQFSMRKKPPATQDNTTRGRDQTSPSTDQDKTGFWTNLKNGFGLFGSGN